MTEHVKQPLGARAERPAVNPLSVLEVIVILAAGVEL